MKLPPLTAEELEPFVTQGRLIAKLATQNQDQSMRITPLTYGVDDARDRLQHLGEQRRGQKRPPRRPRVGPHRQGRPAVCGRPLHRTSTRTVRDHHTRRARASCSVATAATRTNPRRNTEYLTSLGLGDRTEIRFRPETTVTWDFNKV